MSFVGSLEDLGLADILQIISLSGKSGILTLRSEEGEGRVSFDKGLIRSAWVKDGPTDLRELLAARHALSDQELEALCEEASSRGSSLESVVLERTPLDGERLDALRRENVETAVFALFRWGGGEFSFEMRDAAPREASREVDLARGINPQFLALEGARLADEAGAGAAQRAPRDAPQAQGRREPAGVEGQGGPEMGKAHDSRQASEAVARRATPSGPPPVIIIDPDLAVLEWAKQALAKAFPRVHIFQRSELGIARVRQYLARSEVPLVLLSHDAPPDPVSGDQSYSDIATRLQTQAPHMRVVLLTEQIVGRDQAAPPRLEAQPVLEKPPPSLLSGRRGKAQREELAARLREVLLEGGPPSF